MIKGAALGLIGSLAVNTVADLAKSNHVKEKERATVEQLKQEKTAPEVQKFVDTYVRYIRANFTIDMSVDREQIEKDFGSEISSYFEKFAVTRGESRSSSTDRLAISETEKAAQSAKLNYLSSGLLYAAMNGVKNKRIEK